MVPDYQSLMLPILRVCGDGKEHSFRELVELLVEEFDVSEEERRQLLPSGRQPVFTNRVGWAKTYLKKAGLLDSNRRGYVNLTERGKEVLLSNLPRVDAKFLRQFPEFVEFQTVSRLDDLESPDEKLNPEVRLETPQEALENSYERLRNTLKEEVLERVMTASPEFFERLVVELLVAMGYGGSRKDAGERIGGTGDGGIDGIIKEDRLGLDVIYIQAKRWQNIVGRPEVQRFVGALQGQRARKGVFITTSTFTRDAEEYAKNLEAKIVLIDGPRLATYMIDFGIGVTEASVYRVMRLDLDYFSEE